MLQYGPIVNKHEVRLKQIEYGSEGLFVGITSAGHAYIFEDRTFKEIQVGQIAEILKIDIHDAQILLQRRGNIAPEVLKVNSEETTSGPAETVKKVAETFSNEAKGEVSEQVVEPVVENPYGPVSDEETTSGSTEDTLVFEGELVTDFVPEPKPVPELQEEPVVVKVPESVEVVSSESTSDLLQRTVDELVEEKLVEPLPEEPLVENKPSLRARVAALEYVLANDVVTKEMLQTAVAELKAMIIDVAKVILKQGGKQHG